MNERLIEWSKHIKGTVYDLGCGERPYERFILEHANHYVGVDWSNTLHALKADIVADLNEPLQTIDDRVADTVFSISVMEHLCEPQQFLEEAFRILKEGGGLLLQVPFQWHVHEAPYDYFRYTEYGLKYLLAKTGFRNIEVTATTGFWSTMALKANYHSLRYIRGPKLLRYVVRSLLIPFWLADQSIADFLDRIDSDKNETAGYIVMAFK